MKTIITLGLLLATSISFASSCEQAADSAATEKFRNLEYGCYGNARLVQKLNSNTMRVTVDAIGGTGACTQKVYDVKFKDSGRACSIISVTRIGLGGI
jgi:hypothetical protein